MDFYQNLIKPLLFCLEPEKAHTLTEVILSKVGPLLPCRRFERPSTLMGLTLRNPVGLAAGLDKNAKCLWAWRAMGFGFVEVGTVTPRPQTGNPKPRLFRLPEYQAIINRLGFNSLGMHGVEPYLNHRPNDFIVGLNAGKNKETPLENAYEDYAAVISHLFSRADYFTVNISSPNTPGLRYLQEKAYLEPLLSRLKELLVLKNQCCGTKKPLLLKIAPDLSLEAIEILSEVCEQVEIDGIIATNTTIDHQSVAKHPLAAQEGGLSGRPLLAPSTQVLQTLHQHLKGKIPLIGVGGVVDKASAQKKWEAGASAIQLYTGFIYQGPQLIADILS